jgi:hypothetical protein
VPRKACLELKLKSRVLEKANKIIVLRYSFQSRFLQVIFLEVVLLELSVLKNFRVSCLASRADIIHRYLISFKDNYYKFFDIQN